MGFTIGISMVCYGRILEEYTPPHLYSLIVTMKFFLMEIVVSTTTIIASIWLP